MPAKKQMKVLVGILVSLTVLRRSFAASSKARAKRGRYALMVDGRPYLILGGQIHNSSSWPVELPQVWESMAALHANTMAAPAYWEQLEPQEGRFDFSNVDQIVEGARAHNLRLVLLWFGTWKNGNMHYVPSWVKADTKRFSARDPTRWRADRRAFTSFTQHTQCR